MKVRELVNTLAPLMQEVATIYVYCGTEVLYMGFHKGLVDSTNIKNVKSWRWTEHHGRSYLEIEVQ